MKCLIYLYIKPVKRMDIMGVRLYGTSYFDLHKNKKYIKYLNKAFKKYGVNNPISRLSDYEHFNILEKTEQQIAKDFGCEDACLFSSGYLACVSIKNYLLKDAKINKCDIVYNSNFHPSWIDDKMVEMSKSYIDKNNIFISNSLNSFYGKKENYTKYIKKFRKIVIDVSHTAYIWSHKKEADNNVLFFGSLNKASSFPAGFIAGSFEDVKKIKKLAEYTTSTPPSVAFASVFLKMKKLRKQQLKKLKNNMIYMDKILNKNLSSAFPIYNLGKNNDELYDKLRLGDLEVSYMSYPFDYSDKHLRIILNSNTKKSDFKKIKSLLKIK